MTPHKAVIVGVILCILLTGCLTTGGTQSGEYKTVVRTVSPPLNATSDIPKYGHRQPDDEVTTPEPLDTKTKMTGVNVTLLENILAEKLNHYRSVDDSGALVVDPRLARIARHHSYDMATREYVGHTNPDGVTFMNRLERSEYVCGGGRENVQGLLWNTNEIETEEGLAEKILRGFMKSAPHNTAMINPEMTTVGIGIYVTEDPIVYVTMNLCDATPLPEEEEDQ